MSNEVLKKISLVFIVIGCLVFVFGIRQVTVEFFLKFKGKEASAEITDSKMDSSDGIYDLSYQFVHDNQPFSGHIRLNSREQWSRLIQKKGIDIIYYTGNPALHRLAILHGSEKFAIAVLINLTGLCLLFVGVALFFWNKISALLRRFSEEQDARPASSKEELEAFGKKIENYSIEQLENALFLIKKDKFPEKHKLVNDLLARKKGTDPSASHSINED